MKENRCQMFNIMIRDEMSKVQHYEREEVSNVQHYEREQMSNVYH